MFMVLKINAPTALKKLEIHRRRRGDQPISKHFLTPYHAICYYGLFKQVFFYVKIVSEVLWLQYSEISWAWPGSQFFYRFLPENPWYFFLEHELSLANHTLLFSGAWLIECTIQLKLGCNATRAALSFVGTLHHISSNFNDSFLATFWDGGGVLFILFLCFWS